MTNLNTHNLNDAKNAAKLIAWVHAHIYKQMHETDYVIYMHMHVYGYTYVSLLAGTCLCGCLFAHLNTSFQER